MKLQEKFKQWLNTKPNETLRDIQCEIIADEHAIAFHKWCKNNAIKYMLLGSVESYEELMEIYKKNQ